MHIRNQRGIEKLDRQLQGQLVEALELLKDAVDEIRLFAPDTLAEVKIDLLQILNE